MSAIYDELKYLAAEAKPRSEEDYGSERQVDCQNAFFIELEKVLRPDAFAKLEDYCLKATTEEMLDAGILYLEQQMLGAEIWGWGEEVAFPGNDELQILKRDATEELTFVGNLAEIINKLGLR